MSTNRRSTEPTPADFVKALDTLAPKTKARKFQLLLPTIARKIQEGIPHLEIIRVLKEQGLEFTEGTYFNYLQRYRGKTPTIRHIGQASASTTHVPGVTSVSPEPSGGVGRRPPTFDYDPRGIPDAAPLRCRSPRRSAAGSSRSGHFPPPVDRADQADR